MLTFYCPGCWKDFREDLDRCPSCGLDIRGFCRSRDWVDKVILALAHPEPTTPERAAWILGRLREARAVEPLSRLARTSSNTYTVRAAVIALGEIGTPEARKVLTGLRHHRARMVREAVATILEQPEH